MTNDKKNPMNRRSFIALTGTGLAAAAFYPKTSLFAKSVEAIPPTAGATSLAGTWRFAMDRSDAGVAAGWFKKNLTADASISLPGILQTQGYGDEIKADTQFIAALPRDMRWYLLPQYKKYTTPGHVLVPYLSQPVRHYLGVAWYQRDLDIPAGWDGKRVDLFLERTRWKTDVYVDDKLIGSNRSLVAPHEFDLGILKPGKHLLTVRIDNSMQKPDYRFDGHGVSDGEGSTWNGIVGRIELSATSPVWIEDAQVFPNVTTKIAQVRVTIGNVTGKAGSGTLSAGGVSVPVKWEAAGGNAVINVPMPNARLWSEFTPELQNLSLTLSGGQADHQKQVTFGMREIKADGNYITVNGDRLLVRATHDGGGFPLTGYPATDVATWKRIVGICKDWGLNGMRFHSWCPPEAAFTAADELGFFLQPECGMWNSFDAEGKMLAVLNDESGRMLKAYGNHPSFAFLSATNEPAGNYAKQLPIWETALRASDPRRLYTDGTGRYAPPPEAGKPYAADYLITFARGSGGWFGNDFEKALNTSRRGTTIPCIGHEIGQYCSYPDFGIIDKFNGKGKYAAFPNGIGWGKVPYMQPGNYMIMRDSAKDHGMLPRNKELAHASGKFQVACYKEELEGILRTPSYSGYQLLDLHDYLGQGGALIGLLDAFWEEKGYVTAAEFRRFNNTTVPLIRFKDRTNTEQRIFTADQTLTASAEVAHYGPAALKSVTPTWRILNSSGKSVMNGSLPATDVARGSGQALGTITAALSGLPAPAAYSVVLELSGFSNYWNFWLYPAGMKKDVPSDVLVSSSWDEAKTRLAAGGKVLFLSGTPENATRNLTLTSSPIFWNSLMNPNKTWMLGLLNQSKHAALAGFPTEDHCDWQWVNMFPRTIAMNMEAISAPFESIVQPIDDWNRNLRLSMLFECQVGNGKLMVTSFDLSDRAVERTAPAALRKSVVEYMASAKFKPANKVSMSALEAWVPTRYVAPVILNSPPAIGDIVDPSTTKP